MLLYGATIALSAFLLFQIQPIVAKMILPWFGGSAAVWTTTLMFFQLALLAGYVYSYCSIRYLKPKTQAAVHLGLLAVSLLFLPAIPPPSWKPAGGGDPTLGIVLVLAGTVGLPYFMLSTTGPLLQAWYAASRPGAIPYRLFALSNAGSMLALITFPVVVEPYLSSRVQGWVWSGAYAAFAILCGFVAVRASKPGEVVTPDAVIDDAPAGPPSWRRQLLWIGLPACASALLLAVTNHMTQNIAPFPFIWVLTLALYLTTFILCFESERFYLRAVFLPLLTIVLLAMAAATYYTLSRSDGKWTWSQDGNLNIKLAFPLFSVGLFVCCMVCHGELSRLKPHPKYLTKYYLTLALGGAIGGLFVAVVAPRVFSSYLELPIAMVLCAALATIAVWRRLPNIGLRSAAVAFTVFLAVYLAFHENADRRRFVASARNFYGLLRIMDMREQGETLGLRKLVNGTIIHGAQLLDPDSRRMATSYYGLTSGVGRAISLQPARPNMRVGVVGLGAGVLASYCRAGDVFRFYEINPLDKEIANRYFTFLKDCPGDCKVLLGDARLTLERQPPQEFDVLAVDAFSSDAIPVHLLTRQAFQVFVRHLKPDGILAIHVSNRYLDLVPIVARNSEEVQRLAFEIDDVAGDFLSDSDWMLVTPDTHLFSKLAFQGVSIVRRGAPRRLRTWTDDFSNLYQILR
jgi:SAM-dependent methyltransferase